MNSTADFEQIRYEQPAERVVRIMLARADTRNAQGMYNAIHSAFGLHHLGHANARILYQMGVDPAGEKKIRREAREQIENGERRSKRDAGNRP